MSQTTFGFSFTFALLALAYFSDEEKKSFLSLAVGRCTVTSYGLETFNRTQTFISLNGGSSRFGRLAIDIFSFSYTAEGPGQSALFYLVSSVCGSSRMRFYSLGLPVSPTILVCAR
jgi:hypothetical protein